jgi:hypothetical protein
MVNKQTICYTPITIKKLNKLIDNTLIVNYYSLRLYSNANIIAFNTVTKQTES